MSNHEKVAHIIPISDDLFDEMQFYAQAKRRLMREALRANTCPGCGCLVPANEQIKRCNVCGHEVCDGCVTDNGACQLCADIKEERER